VCSFETGHGKRIGLLRVRGKNKKQRALFVADRLFDQLLRTAQLKIRLGDI
jgi:integrase/recombinase XerD